MYPFVKSVSYILFGVETMTALGDFIVVISFLLSTRFIERICLLLLFLLTLISDL